MRQRLPLRRQVRERELRRVQQLHRQASPHLHLLRVERRVRARPAVRGPVAHRVRAVLLQQVHRRDHVALRLRHLLAVRVQHPAGDRRVPPRQLALVQVRAQDRREQPRADDVVRLRTHVHREHLREQLAHPRPPVPRSAASATRSPTCPSRPGRPRSHPAVHAGRARSRRARRWRGRRATATRARPKAAHKRPCPPRRSDTRAGTARRRSAGGSRTSRPSARSPSPPGARACTAGATSARDRARAAARGARSCG